MERSSAANERYTTDGGMTYLVSIEEAPVEYARTFPPVDRGGSAQGAYRSTVLALIMAILGSSVLPVAYAFARTGIMPGLLLSVVVGLCNTYTCHMLLNVALATKMSTFEELCDAVGGRRFKAFAQVSNVVLLMGNLTGDLCLLADLGYKSLVNTLGDKAPRLLIAHHGRGVMLLLTAVVILPISLCRGMRALEHVSSGGLVILAILLAVLLMDAVSAGFEGVTSGEVPLLWVPGDSKGLAEAFALLGFSFYLHPLMMPMLPEMPAGAPGVSIMARAVTVVIMGVALATYAAIGALGAAAFGAGTEGDIMMNSLLSGHPVGAAALAIAVLIYLGSCIPPLILSLRCYLDFVLVGPRAGFKWTRFLALTLGIVVIPFSLAWHNPSLSETAFSLTGATGVCIVCYVIPIVAHFKLMYAAAPPRSIDADNAAAGLLDVLSPQADSVDERQAAGRYLEPPASWRQWVLHVARPLAVLALGVGLSALAVWNTFI